MYLGFEAGGTPCPSLPPLLPPVLFLFPPPSTWRFGVAVTRWLDQCSCSTSSPVSTGMGDCLWVGKLSHYVRNQPPRPTQPGHPSVGRRNEYWRWLQEENGEFCVAVAPATRTASILTQLVKGAGC